MKQPHNVEPDRQQYGVKTALLLSALLAPPRARAAFVNLTVLGKAAVFLLEAAPHKPRASETTLSTTTHSKKLKKRHQQG